MAEFLFEIGLEEVPARMIAGAEAELRERVVKMLGRERLVADGAASKSFATPRRLAVWVEGVAERQEDVAEEMVGPPVKVAYKDGAPGPAAVKFAEKAGVAVEALKVVTTAKGEYLAATAVKAGRGAAEVIAAELPKELVGIYWAKNMRWIPGKPDRFVRPVRWIVALLGDEIVPVEFGGKTAGAVTYGHRVLFGEQEIPLKAAGEYEAALLKGFVVADVEARRQRIRKGLDAATRTVPSAHWREDEELVETVTQLTEWPSVLLGGFEKEYLALPEEVLVTVMRDHQKYFAVEDAAGKLAPHFLTVLNTEADAAGQAVIRHGNERVLRARFNDARFFWEFDQKITLMERRKLLEKVTFQKDLGSYHKKSQATLGTARGIVSYLESHHVAMDRNAIDTAVLLAKTDLTTELVKEFTELQGIIGGLYAKTQGFGDGVTLAIYDQYKPESMEDSIPRTIEGTILAIADKASTIAGMFGLKMEPTGSKDPFALRRAANGIVKILAETGLPIGLLNIAVSSCAAFPSKLAPEDLRDRMCLFFAERVEFYLRDIKGFAYDVVKAVMAVGADDVRDAIARAEALTAVRGSEDFVAVSSAFKRMKNILVQARETGILDIRVEIPSQVIGNPAQNGLTEAAGKISEKFIKLAANHEYVAALEMIATLRPQIDRFFNEVMVMDDDPYVRNSRLSLLDSLVQTFSKIADFSEIVVAG